MRDLFHSPARPAAGRFLRIVTKTAVATYLSLPGVAGNNASTADTAGNSIVGDMDVRMKIAADDWTPASQAMLITKWQAGAAANRQFALSLDTDGTLIFYWSADGSAGLNAVSTAAVGAANGAIKWVRATIDVDNGAVGRDIKFYTSDDGTTWTQLGTTVTQAGVTSIFDSTQLLRIGTEQTDTSFLFVGKVYSAELRNGIGGSVVASFAASDGNRGDSSLVSSATSETWAINTSGGSPAILVGDTSGTTSADCTTIRARLVGGGGAGGAAATAGSSAGAGSGGGAGGYAEKTFTVTPNTAYTYAIGASGQVGPPATAGGDTTLTVGATTVTAKGGNAGAAGTAGTTAAFVAGGAITAVSTNGDVNSAGGPGDMGVRVSGTVGQSGNGANSPLGAGGTGLSSAGAGVAAIGAGSGGGGGLVLNGSSAVVGGRGAPGLIVIEEYS